MKRPLILVEDDQDDQEIIFNTLRKIGFNDEIFLFKDGEEALDYLRQSEDKPFLILSDINMPKMDGITLKKEIELNENLKRKSIPFIYLSTTSNTTQVKLAYELTVQGFFEKGSSFQQLQENLTVILRYWQHSKMPV